MADTRGKEEIEAEIRALQALAEATDDLVKKEELRVEIFEELQALQRKQTGDNAEALKTLKAQTKALRENAEMLQEQAEAGEAVAEGLGGLVGLTKDYESSMLGSISTVLSSKAAQQGLAEQLKKTFSAQNLAYGMITKITQATVKLAFDQDKALVAFNKQTGAARLYGNELLDLEDRMYTQGVTMEEAGEAFGALTRNVHGLRTMSKSVRTDLVNTTALLQELGVSAETTGANVHFMTRVLGLGTAESGRYQRELFALAQEIGMPPQEMAEGFKAAQPKLAAFGKDAGKTFKKLAVAARASGMEVEQLLGLVEQFDTFEGAATSVGKLNALLGGPFLNSMEMVMQTDPTERMRMLSGALNNAGKSFDQLSYYEKKSIAAAAGLSDVNELALVMAGNFNGMAGGAHKSQAEIQRLAKQTEEMNEIWDELNQVARMFAIEMRPVLKNAKAWLQWIQEFHKEAKILVPQLALFSSAFLAVSSAMSAGLAAVRLGLLSAGYAATHWWAALLAPLAAAYAVVIVFKKVYEWTGELDKALYAASITAGIAAVAMYALAGGVAAVIWSVLLVIGVVTGLVMGLIWLGDRLFNHDVGASTFLEGLVKIGHAFAEIGIGMLFAAMSAGPLVGAMLALIALTGPLALSTLPGGAFWSMSTGLGWIADALERIEPSALGGLTALFATLAEMTAEVADNVYKIGEGLQLAGVGLSVMALNPLALAALPAIMAGISAGTAANAAASRSTYTSTQEGTVSKSGGTSSQALPPRKIEIVVHTDPLFKRYFTTDVTEIIGGRKSPLNANTGGTP